MGAGKVQTRARVLRRHLAEIKDLIASTIERVTLDPLDLSCRIHYRIVADMWVSMASPRGFEPLLPP